MSELSNYSGWKQVSNLLLNFISDSAQNSLWNSLISSLGSERQSLELCSLCVFLSLLKAMSFDFFPRVVFLGNDPIILLLTGSRAMGTQTTYLQVLYSFAGKNELTLSIPEESYLSLSIMHFCFYVIGGINYKLNVPGTSEKNPPCD